MNRLTFKILIGLFVLVQSFSYSAMDVQGQENDIFAQRRQEFMEKMEKGVAVFISDNVSNRNGDVNYEFRQNSDFYYLTGFKNPQSAFLLLPESSHQFIMFVRPKNPFREMWTGRRYGTEGAMKIFGADTAFSIDQFENVLPQYLQGKTEVYYNFENKKLNDQIMNIIGRSWGNYPDTTINPIPWIHEMRVVKSPEEIALLRKAIDITCYSHIETMKSVKPGMFEYELEAIIEYIFRKNGASSPGFPSIVGSGPNTTILHYQKNNRQIENGDLILMDTGAEYNYYTADVTRTIPANGTFSDKQKEIYEIVLKSADEAMKRIKPGVGIQKIHNRAVEVVKVGLYQLGLITDKESDWQHRVYLMYNINHWLGLDVHDPSAYHRGDDIGRRLRPGMVFTVEPGIYISENTYEALLERGDEFAPEKEIKDFIQKVKPVAKNYYEIGIRIEDDILVTDTGYENLSARAPRKINEIEKLMKQKSVLNNPTIGKQ